MTEFKVGQWVRIDGVGVGRVFVVDFRNKRITAAMLPKPHGFGLENCNAQLESVKPWTPEPGEWVRATASFRATKYTCDPIRNREPWQVTAVVGDEVRCLTEHWNYLMSREFVEPCPPPASQQAEPVYSSALEEPKRFGCDRCGSRVKGPGMLCDGCEIASAPKPSLCACGAELMGKFQFTRRMLCGECRLKADIAKTKAELDRPLPPKAEPKRWEAFSTPSWDYP